MATAKERIKDLLQRMPEQEAEELERLLLEASRRTEDGWQPLASAAFAAFFEGGEYEYPADAGTPE